MYQWKRRNKAYAAYTKKSWTMKDNQVLYNLVLQNGPGNWKEIADIFNKERGISRKVNGKQ